MFIGFSVFETIIQSLFFFFYRNCICVIRMKSTCHHKIMSLRTTMKEEGLQPVLWVAAVKSRKKTALTF